MGEKKDVPVKIIAGNGTARMKGTRMSEEGVGRMLRDPGEGWRMGRMENWVRRRVRPMASGRERRSSSASVGRAGSRVRREVRVWMASVIHISLFLAGQKGKKYG
jgi:hypothetical protein